MKPATLLAIIVAVLLIGVGLLLWQLDVFKSEPPQQPPESSGLVEVPPPDSAVTPTILSGSPFTSTSPSPFGTEATTHQPEVPTFSAGTEYVVKGGDTLWSIAQHFYQDGTKLNLIYDANKVVIGSDPNRLKVGMKLTIPATGGGGHSGMPPQPTYSEAPAIGGQYHTVKKGDTLTSIAQKYYKTSKKKNLIFEANRDKLATMETTLKPSWKLLIPDASATPKPSSQPPAPPVSQPRPKDNVPSGEADG